jgi:hypothetical protein
MTLIDGEPVGHNEEPLENIGAMKLGTLGRLATVLLFIGTVAVLATGCVFIPYPVGGYGHYGHDEQDGRPYRR